MPNYDDVLREHTHKDQGLSVEERVFYTLKDGRLGHEERTSIMLAKLTAALVDAEIITEDRLDEILLKAAGQ
jgi:hypothetical protein